MISNAIAILSFLFLSIEVHLVSAASIHGNKLEPRGTILGENLFNPTIPWLSPTCRLGLISYEGKQWGAYPFGKDPPQRPAWLEGQAVKDFFATGNRPHFWRLPQDDWAYQQGGKPCWNIDTDVGPSFADDGLKEYFIAGYCFCQFFLNRDCNGYMVVGDGLPQTTGYIGLEEKTKGFGRLERVGNPRKFYKSFACYATSTQYDSQCKISISNLGDQVEGLNKVDGLTKALKIIRNFNIPLRTFDAESREVAAEEAEEGDAVIEMFTGRGSCLRVSDVRPYTSESGIQMRWWEIENCTCRFYITENCEGRPILVDGSLGKVTRDESQWGPVGLKNAYSRPKIKSLRCDAPYGIPSTTRNRW
ncbi:hypothetical protein TWF225_002146 [Orbilia oligospora]|uniref:Uncharacterized protein n=1 Tax=Orbilia oligospora TaxID=2813651 RepID=A0A7C8PB76_ORBOL|nr:hypothetical protein TWF751_009064 [Orbilia oligospora]KAF3190383.1 hypothetical protein TWF225_002146 [Orbilia oligospora]KAF3242741.1 hypothetical protein TWF217_011450 [Orbilia oligospora]KAF3258003.1 hypothetical protein TWF128_004902 [Orbilia oligospora]KAF3280060.1 hypothetical protein TWF132_011908 [Orbilia oligospora]